MRLEMRRDKHFCIYISYRFINLLYNCSYYILTSLTFVIISNIIPNEQVDNPQFHFTDQSNIYMAMVHFALVDYSFELHTEIWIFRYSHWC